MEVSSPNLTVEPRLVGRQKELKILKDHFDNIREKNKSTIFISGEAGLGKTRLVQEFKKSVNKKDDVRFIQGSCLHKSMEPLLPIKKGLREENLEHLISRDPPPKVLSAYLIDESGLLIAKAEREESRLDADIFAPMLEMIKSFVKDSLSNMDKVDDSSGLNTIGYGKYNILIQSEKNFSIATIIEGSKNEVLIKEMKEKLLDVKEDLESWDGDMSETDKVKEQVSWFIKSNKYKDGLTVDDPEIKKDNLFENIILGLKRLSNDKHIILFIDDLQWADPMTLSLIHYLSRNIQEENIMLIGTYRPEDIISDENEEKHIFKKTRQKMSKEGLYKEIKLERLTRGDSKKIVHSILCDTNIDEGLFKDIYVESEGNPFFILEIIKLLVEERYLIKKDGIWVFDKDIDSFDIPPKINDIIERRLDRLTNQQRRILRCGSVEGEPFCSKIIEEVLDINRVSLLEDLDKIKNDHQLINNGKDGYKFEHGKIKDVLYQDINEELKKEYHKRIAEVHENTPELDSNPEVIGHHFYKADDKRGISYLIKAAERSKERYANKEGINFYQNALTLIDDEESKESKKIYRSLGELYSVIGEYDEALEKYNTLKKMTDDKEIKIDLYGKIAEIYRETGNYEKSLENIDKGLDIASEHNELRSELLKGKGWTLIRQGDYEEAEKVLEKGKELAEVSGDMDKRGNIYLALGALYYHTSDYENSEHHIKESINIFEEIENLKKLSASYNNFALVYSAVGEPDKSLEYHEKCLEMSKEIGRKRTIAVSLNNMGNLYLNMGQIQKGLEKHKKGLEIKEEIGDRFGIATSLNNIGDIYLTLSKLEKALEYEEKALDLSDEIGYKKGASIALHNIGEIYFNQDELDKALEKYEQSIEIDKGIGRKKGMAINLSRLTEVHLNKGDIFKAEEDAERALDISKEANSKEEEGMSKRSLGMVYRVQEKWDEAIKMFNDGIEVLKDSGNERDLAKIHYEYGILLKKKEDLKIARVNLEKALEIFEEMGMKIWVDRVNEVLKGIK